MPKYFCFDGVDFHTFDTELEAKKWALDSMDNYRDEADEGWPDESLNVHYGVVVGSSQITEERPPEPHEAISNDVDMVQCREIVDAENRPLEFVQITTSVQDGAVYFTALDNHGKLWDRHAMIEGWHPVCMKLASELE